MAARKVKKKKADNTDVNVDSFAARRELVTLDSIEMIHGRKKKTKEERVAALKVVLFYCYRYSIAYK